MRAAPLQDPAIELGPREQPAWIVRHGIWVVIAGFAVLFAGAELIPYENVVSAPVVVDAADTMQAVSEGRVHLLVREGEVVRPGQRIASIDRLRPSTTAIIYLPRSAAASVHPPQAATIDAGGRRIPATITAVLAGEGDRVPVRISTSFDLPPRTRGTAWIRLHRTKLLPQLLGFSAHQ